ncbi:hypothetical protein [Xanthomonas oryzae]|uniref:hypothetical protein n=1 Tax=Xanthomonas oryzae TaxID=347 RepID=UPI0011BFD21B|nr:hypothetical protein [Xanthomonas oryzae]
MNLKFLLCSTIIGISLLGCAEDASAERDNPADWPGSITGKCYPSLKDYISSAFPWTKDGDDENIQVTEVSKAKNLENFYTWIIDKTPGTNVTRTLFRVSKTQACAVLNAPMSSSIEFKMANNKLPNEAISIDTPPPGMPMTKIIYKLDSDSEDFHPYRCETITQSSGIAKKIDCLEAFKSNTD